MKSLRSLFTFSAMLLMLAGYQFITAQSWTNAPANPPQQNTPPPINKGVNASSNQWGYGSVLFDKLAATESVNSDLYCDGLGENCVSVPFYQDGENEATPFPSQYEKSCTGEYCQIFCNEGDVRTACSTYDPSDIGENNEADALPVSPNGCQTGKESDATVYAYCLNTVVGPAECEVTLGSRVEASNGSVLTSKTQSFYFKKGETIQIGAAGSCNDWPTHNFSNTSMVYKWGSSLFDHSEKAVTGYYSGSVVGISHPAGVVVDSLMVDEGNTANAQDYACNSGGVQTNVYVDATVSNCLN